MVIVISISAYAQEMTGMVTSTIHVLILVPVFFVIMKERALRKGLLQALNQITLEEP